MRVVLGIMREVERLHSDACDIATSEHVLFQYLKTGIACLFWIITACRLSIKQDSVGRDEVSLDLLRREAAWDEMWRKGIW